MDWQAEIYFWMWLVFPGSLVVFALMLSLSLVLALRKVLLLPARLLMGLFRAWQ